MPGRAGPGRETHRGPGLRCAPSTRPFRIFNGASSLGDVGQARFIRPAVAAMPRWAMAGMKPTRARPTSTPACVIPDEPRRRRDAPTPASYDRTVLSRCFRAVEAGRVWGIFSRKRSERQTSRSRTAKEDFIRVRGFEAAKGSRLADARKISLITDFFQIRVANLFSSEKLPNL